MSEKDELEKWILENMTIDVKEKLSEHKDRVKQYMEFTESGEIMLRESDHIPTWARIILYAIGKLYAHYARLTPEKVVSAKELIATLNLPEGTVKSAIFRLRNNGWIFAQEGVYQVRYGSIGQILDTIDQALRGR